MVWEDWESHQCTCLRPKCAEKEDRDEKEEKGSRKGGRRQRARWKQLLRVLKHAERCTLQWWMATFTAMGTLFWGEGPGPSELPFRSTSLGYILPKDTYRLPPRNKIFKDIFPYVITVCTQCGTSEMGTISRGGGISDKIAFTSPIWINTVKVFPVLMEYHLSQQLILVLPFTKWQQFV